MSSKISPAETILVELVHDLRQHLGNIETSVYCLGLVSDPVESRAHRYNRTIEEQVANAESRLSDAGAALNRLRAQRSEAAENLEFTNSTTVGVT